MTSCGEDRRSDKFESDRSENTVRIVNIILQMNQVRRRRYRMWPIPTTEIVWNAADNRIQENVESLSPQIDLSRPRRRTSAAIRHDEYTADIIPSGDDPSRCRIRGTPGAARVQHALRVSGVDPFNTDDGRLMASREPRTPSRCPTNQPVITRSVRAD